jgi:serine/threonine protein kinase
VLGRGYNHSVDWWTLGVLMYVLLTARQPFSSPKTHDPMEVMRRIVDERWPVKYPPYMSPEAKDLIQRLLERKPAKRIGMLQGRAADIKNHRWFAVRAQRETQLVEREVSRGPHVGVAAATGPWRALWCGACTALRVNRS